MFREKPSMMLVVLYNTDKDLYASALAKKVDCTYSHVVKVLQDMERSDLLSFKKRGRLKIISLTSRGKKVAKSIDDVRRVL